MLIGRPYVRVMCMDYVLATGQQMFTIGFLLGIMVALLLHILVGGIRNGKAD